MLLTPFLFLLAASLLVRLFSRVKVAKPNNVRKLLLVGLSGLVIVSLMLPVTRTLKNNIQLTTVDSREAARIWITDRLPSGARIAIESYAPFADPEHFSVQGFLRIIDNSPNWYIDNGFEYLVFSQGMFGRFYREPDRYSSEVSQYNNFFNQFRLLEVFTDGGYEVRIYQVSEN
jgi:xanthosine utilization system XapX-like protein